MDRAVVVCNVFPDDNKGGCAITQQTIEWLKRVFPDSPVFLVPVEQTGAQEISRLRFTLQRHPDTGILRSPIHTDGSFPRTCVMLFRSLRLLWGRPGNSAFERTIADAEVVVSKGGYVFIERGTIRGLLGLWFTAFPLLYASRRKVPAVALCTTVGPYKRMLSRALCGWILKRVDVVVTRDPISTEQARALGCRTVREAPDIVLTFDERRVDSRHRWEHPSGETYGVVVISGGTSKPDDVFLKRLGDLAERVLSEKVVDKLVVVLQSIEDSRISARFVRRCRDPRVELIETDLSPEELMAIYAGADFLIARRLHAGVFALLVGTPVVLFSTDGVKTDGVMRELGLSNRVFPHPDFSVDEVHRSLIAMLGRREEEQKVIGEKVSAARLRAAAELRALGEHLRSRKQSAQEPTELSV